MKLKFYTYLIKLRPIKKYKDRIANAIANVQLNDGVKHYYYLKDNIIRIRSLMDEGEIFVGAYFKTKLIGFVSFRKVPAICLRKPSIQIRFLEVNKNFTNKKCGLLLLEFVESAAVFNKIDNIVSHVELNSQKENYLIKRGFAFNKVHKNYYNFKDKKFNASCWFKKVKSTRSTLLKIQEPKVEIINGVKSFKSGGRVYHL